MQKINTPEWVKHAVFYQIFPDRFARSSRNKLPPGIEFKSWGTPPEEQGFQGGDLLGIVDKLDYLEDLGANTLYLNPIFSSAANHRYHPYDYLNVDPLLGGNNALRELIDKVHDRGMRIILDGVFNHASRGFWPFHHILENEQNSPYLDWFIIHDLPLRPYPNTQGDDLNYESWRGLPALPKLNTGNPAVRDFIFDVARHWLEFGADGWRLDVPMEIDDAAFWEEFRQVIKSTDPEAYIVGEIWVPAQDWLQGDRFDAVMNYIFMWITLSFFGAKTLRSDYQREKLLLKPINAPEFKKLIDKMHARYDWEINHAQLNLLDSHDTARALWIVGEDKSALRLSVLFQMTMPGAPCIYYGDEIGMSGADDPYCRAAFPWKDKSTWDSDLLDFYRRAVALRHRYQVLRTGSFNSLYAKDGVYAFNRKLKTQEAILIFNTQTKLTKCKIPVQPSPDFEQAYPKNRIRFVKKDNFIQIDLPPRDALILISEDN